MSAFADLLCQQNSMWRCLGWFSKALQACGVVWWPGTEGSRCASIFGYVVKVPLHVKCEWGACSSPEVVGGGRAPSGRTRRSALPRRWIVAAATVCRGWGASGAGHRTTPRRSDVTSRSRDAMCGSSGWGFVDVCPAGGHGGPHSRDAVVGQADRGFAT